MQHVLSWAEMLAAQIWAEVIGKLTRLTWPGMLGKLTWAAIPLNEPLPLISAAVVGIVLLVVLGLITARGWWPYLWRAWLTSVDHKRIGVMYVCLGLVMLLRGFADAIMMRTQQALAVGDVVGYLLPTTTTRSSPRTARS